MSNIRIFLRPEAIKETISLDDKEIIHKLKNVLRLSSGESLLVFDGQGKEYLYKIIKLQSKTLEINKDKEVRFKPQAKHKLILGFPVIEEDKIDFILQKATELGVDQFVPFICERSLHIKSFSHKIKRWQTIIVEGARQSEQLWLPVIKDIVEFKDILVYDCPLKLAAAINGQNLKDLMPENKSDIFVIVGPKGDFSPLEYKLLTSAQFKFLNLSENLLRVETAATVAVGLIKYFFYLP